MSKLRARAAQHEKEVNAALAGNGREQLLSQLRSLLERLPPIVSDDEI